MTPTFPGKPSAPAIRPGHRLARGPALLVAMPDGSPTPADLVTGRAGAPNSGGVAGATGSPAPAGSPWGAALAFAGSTTRELRYAGAGWATPPEAFTSFALVRIDASSNVFHYLVAQGTGLSAPGLALNVSDDANGRRLRLYDGAANQQADSGLAVPLGRWLAVAVACRPATRAVTFYRGDCEAGTVASSATTFPVAVVGTGDGTATVNPRLGIGQIGIVGSLALAGWSRALWSADDFAAFFADPFAMVRPAHTAWIAAAASPPPAFVPAGNLGWVSGSPFTYLTG